MENILQYKNVPRLLSNNIQINIPTRIYVKLHIIQRSQKCVQKLAY